MIYINLFAVYGLKEAFEIIYFSIKILISNIHWIKSWGKYKIWSVNKICFVKENSIKYR